MFSWEQPIEIEILEYTRVMARAMEGVAVRHHSKKIREHSILMAKAYRTVEKHIMDEIELRRKIDEKS